MPNLGAPELIVLLLVIILLFGSRKLPETARGLGRALRIFKSETKGLRDDDPEPAPHEPEAPRQITRPTEPEVTEVRKVADPDVSDR
jgi:sec-independent protein translocase protein TatA